MLAAPPRLSGAVTPPGRAAEMDGAAPGLTVSREQLLQLVVARLVLRQPWSRIRALLVPANPGHTLEERKPRASFGAPQQVPGDHEDMSPAPSGAGRQARCRSCAARRNDTVMLM